MNVTKEEILNNEIILYLGTDRTSKICYQHIQATGLADKVNIKILTVTDLQNRIDIKKCCGNLKTPRIEFLNKVKTLTKAHELLKQITRIVGV